MNKIYITVCLFLIFEINFAQSGEKRLVTVDEITSGIAAIYPLDEGIENDESVLFTEKFEESSMTELLKNWTGNLGSKDGRISLDAIKGPDGSLDNKCLKMTIWRDRGENGSGSALKKIFNQGYEQLFFRFYVKFADDYGFNHHFTSMSGDMHPTPWHVGRAGLKPVEHFLSSIDMYTSNMNKTGPDHTPPGYWFFYSYWPEMRSWQNLDGSPDGRPNAYYGNDFMPMHPVAAKRGEWQCVEIMIRLNSAPDKADGAHAFWIDGELIGHWDPLEKNPVEGYWIREKFRTNPGYKDAKPFAGIKWRTFDDIENFERFKINVINLQNYVSGTSWKRADKYAEEHPDFDINLQEATVWKDNVVVATKYIGPIQPEKQ